MISFELILVIVFLVTTVLGYFLIKNVPSLLHTPLMSGMNALSGVTVLATMTSTALAIITGSKVAGFFGIVCAMCNVVAGFGLTNRMLKMFKHSKEKDHTQKEV